ncbi:MAG: MBL fold metallo-hydrolase [Chloroflexota bacterium]|nr:MBL fold metallo-hydrolase [Chloroflexota bacterium]
MADVKWLGNTCFRIKSREAMVLMDPIARDSGMTMPKQKADIVTLSMRGRANALANVEGEYTLIEGPGEYEVQEVFLSGIRTRRNGTGGAQKDFNTVYLVEMDEMIFCHLGSLNKPLTEAQVEAMGDVDVLFVPIGGEDSLSPAGATEVIGQIEPRLVIPMRYKINDEAGKRALGEFAAALGLTEVPREDRLIIRKNTLPETMGVTVLDV